MTGNPFEITKAVDFTDEQIEHNWVDLPGGGFNSLADPRSPMPRFLVGGKGGGRTHLLRYFSYPLQRLRHSNDLLNGIRADGYVGIYFRCGGLNSSRFSGKRQSHDTWQAVFSYYTEVWLGRLTIDLIADLYSEAVLERKDDEVRAFTQAVVNLFDADFILEADNGGSLKALAGAFHRTQRQLDLAINNAALNHRLDVDIQATPGRLVFGIPAAASQHLTLLSGMIFAYLLDEFENLTIDQQRYVNTLIREKQLPTTFLVGSRQFGLRTHETLSAAEENKQGSEFDLVVLEERYRANPNHYSSFCEEIVLKRLQALDMNAGPRTRLNDYFAAPDVYGKTVEERALYYARKRRNASETPPWLVRLKDQLSGLSSNVDISSLLECVSFPESPLHEKFGIFLLYRAWADGDNLAEAAERNRQSIQRLLTNSENGKSLTTYNHYKLDLYAQILDELDIDQEYYSLDAFIDMSGFLPRNLIVLLKQVTRWSTFLGEQPFRGNKISLKAQSEGVREASTWFLNDAKGLGRIGEETQFAIRRLASLFRDMRFSDKPVEVSCSTFSTDRQGLSSAAAQSLDEAVSHNLLLEVPNGRRDKNSQVLHHKYQLNPMLAPLFDLSLARRGSASFSSTELNALFDPHVDESNYNRVRRRMISRMQAPFMTEPSPNSPVQSLLPFE